MSTLRRLRSLLLIASTFNCVSSPLCFGQQIAHSISGSSVWIEDQSLPQGYLSSYQKWLEGEISNSNKIQNEIGQVLKLPIIKFDSLLTPTNYAEIVFSRSDGSLPSNLELIKGNDERIDCFVHRLADGLKDQMATDEVMFVCETEVPPESALAYRKLGLFVDPPIKNSDTARILKASFFCNVKARCYLATRN